MKRFLTPAVAALMAASAVAQQSFDLPPPKPKPAPATPAPSPAQPAATPAPARREDPTPATPATIGESVRIKPTSTPEKPAAAESAARHYRNGEFPRGTTYRASDLAKAAGEKLPRHAYLTGKLLYQGRKGGVHIFTTFATLPGAYVKSLRGQRASAADVAEGNTVIEVTFPDNFPRGLTPGRVIAPNDECPLTLQSVRRSSDGKLSAKAISEAMP